MYRSPKSTSSEKNEVRTVSELSSSRELNGKNVFQRAVHGNHRLSTLDISTSSIANTAVGNGKRSVSMKFT